MPLYRTYRQDDLVVGVWKVVETLEQLCSMFQHFSFYESDYARFTSEKRKQEWLAVRALLKELCGEEKEIAYYPSGKPYLVDGSAYISFSHTSGYVAVAVSRLSEVAVDIEQYGTRVHRVASKFIRSDEELSIKAAANETYALLIHWSAKETLFKLLGEEGVDFINHLHILPCVPAEKGQLMALEYRTPNHRSFFIDYWTHPDFVLTYSSALSQL